MFLFESHALNCTQMLLDHHLVMHLIVYKCYLTVPMIMMPLYPAGPCGLVRLFQRERHANRIPYVENHLRADTKLVNAQP